MKYLSNCAIVLAALLLPLVTDSVVSLWHLIVCVSFVELFSPGLPLLRGQLAPSQAASTPQAPWQHLQYFYREYF